MAGLLFGFSTATYVILWAVFLIGRDPTGASYVPMVFWVPGYFGICYLVGNLYAKAIPLTIEAAKLSLAMASIPGLYFWYRIGTAGWATASAEFPKWAAMTGVFLVTPFFVDGGKAVILPGESRRRPWDERAVLGKSVEVIVQLVINIAASLIVYLFTRQ